MEQREEEPAFESLEYDTLIDSLVEFSRVFVEDSEVQVHCRELTYAVFAFAVDEIEEDPLICDESIDFPEFLLVQLGGALPKRLAKELEYLRSPRFFDCDKLILEPFRHMVPIVEVLIGVTVLHLEFLQHGGHHVGFFGEDDIGHPVLANQLEEVEEQLLEQLLIVLQEEAHADHGQPQVGVLSHEVAHCEGLSVGT
jgi:hypothetical protein